MDKGVPGKDYTGTINFFLNKISTSTHKLNPHKWYPQIQTLSEFSDCQYSCGAKILLRFFFLLNISRWVKDGIEQFEQTDKNLLP